MNFRKTTSLTALLSFSGLVTTSIILYIVPAGRVANWAGWELWGLSKDQWGAVHTNLGFFFLLSIILHIFYNWTPMISYLKNRSKQVRIFTPDFNVSVLATVVVIVGTLAGLPPFSSFLELSASIKDDANKFYGEAPYGHAELSPIDSFVDKVKLDLDGSIKHLKDAGISVESEKQTLMEIAEANGITPNQIYQVIKPVDETELTVMPEEPPGGTGHNTIADVCETYNLDPAVIINGLKSVGITAGIDQTIKEVGIANSKGPHDIYEAIRMISLQ